MFKDLCRRKGKFDPFLGLEIFLLLILTMAAPAGADEPLITAGSKTFTESVILGEIAVQLADLAGYPTLYQNELGGTRILFNSLVKGEIDVYPEYTGTIKEEIFRDRNIRSDKQMKALLKEKGIGITPPLGFNNTYAIGMLPERAEELNIKNISDLRRYPVLKFGFSNEFLDRGDGWPNLKRYYSLPHSDVTGMDHDLAYRALEAGQIDVIDVYNTDAEIAYYGLKIIEDNRDYFPEYNAVYLYRRELNREAPDYIELLCSVSGRINEARMRKMNAQAKIEKIGESFIAAEFLEEEFGYNVTVEEETLVSNI